MSRAFHFHAPRLAAVGLLVSAAACADAPTASPDALLARGGPKAAPNSEGRIIFGSFMTGNHDIFSVNPDGSGLRRLTYDGLDEMYPAVSPDGRKIAYLKARTSGPPKLDLWIMNADGSRQQMRLQAPDDIYSINPPAWAPDGKSLLISWQDNITAQMHIATLPVNSGAPVELPIQGILASYSPDGQYLAYMKDVNGARQLFTSRPDGSDPYQWTDLTNCCGIPRWSPDGTRVLFAADIGGYTLAATNSTGNWNILQTGAPPLGSGAWSPDGAKIVFASGPGDLWVSLANGAGATPILMGAMAYSMSWSR